MGSWFTETQGRPPSEHGGPVDRNDFALPGAQQRGAYWNDQAQAAQGRTAPQSANDSSFRGDQQGAINMLRQRAQDADLNAASLVRNYTDEGMRQQRSLAATANPNNAAMMARLSAQNIGQMHQGAASQASQIATGERNAAVAGIGGIAGQGRGQDLANNQFNASATLQNRGMNDQYSLGSGALDLNNAQAQQSGNMGYAQNETNRYGMDMSVPQGPNNFERTAGMVIKGGQVAAATGIISDERMKTGVTNGAPSADRMLDRLAANLTPATYNYKDETNGRGPRLGVMAQDVERGGPAGRDLVSEQAGMKTLDIPKSVGTALGLIGRLGERLDRIEGTAARTKQTTRPASST